MGVADYIQVKMFSIISLIFLLSTASEEIYSCLREITDHKMKCVPSDGLHQRHGILRTLARVQMMKQGQLYCTPLTMGRLSPCMTAQMEIEVTTTSKSR